MAEVASIGGYVKEYQVDINPTAMKSFDINVADVMSAVKKSNLDVGARTIEFNKAEYLVRGLGYIKSIDDLEETVILARNNVPVRIKDIARVKMGPATRRGGLDKAGVEAVGAVVVARYGSNPLEVIENVKAKMQEISQGLPSKMLADGTRSKVTIIPFYDRTGLIMETLGTLEEALTLEVLISIIVVVILVFNLRASLLISSLLPLGVLFTFIAMRYFNVSANIVALSGIAIAIGVMVDVGIVFTENILRHLKMPQHIGLGYAGKMKVIYDATTEVSSAVLTALSTTIISFIPVFALQAQEGKLFQPLAFTKTFALIAALFIGIAIIPALAHWIFSIETRKSGIQKYWYTILFLAGIALLFFLPWAGIVLMLISLNYYFRNRWKNQWSNIPKIINTALLIFTVLYFLVDRWLPLGPEASTLANVFFTAIIITSILGTLVLVVIFYRQILSWCLENKTAFLILPVLILLFGVLSWQGFNNVFGVLNKGGDLIGVDLRDTKIWEAMSDVFPGTGKEFMPPLDEGSFLLMPTTMPHSGIQENVETIQLLDQLVTSIPEVELTVGKWGRVQSALDPAPISMFENVINYKPEYILNEDGHRMRFKVNDNGDFILKNQELFAWDSEKLDGFNCQLLIPDNDGNYFRQWRTHIRSSDDIWNEIVKMANLPGMTSAPKLQPIATRLVMLSTGMRAPMGMKIYGPDLETIEATGFQMEELLKQVKGIRPRSVFADRVVGKPYLEINIDRRAIARYGLSIEDMQMYVGTAIGGNTLTTSVEGRERYAVRVRYARELRDNPSDLKNVLIPTPTGVQVPLQELAELNYVRGPQNIKSEDTFLVSYVIFDKEDGYSEIDLVESAQELLKAKIREGSLTIPAGVSYKFTGNYEHQIRAIKRLSIVIPISLLAILVILYFQFGRIQPTLMVFSGVFVAFAGGFITIWLYDQSWFLNFSLFDTNMRDLFQVSTINMSVAVWVGFIALFGVATDDGVIMGTYLNQHFTKEKPDTINGIRAAVLMAGQQRVRPAMMTAATTIIALIPVLTSTGKGSDIMVPMAIPTFGGMIIQVITMFVVPVLYCMWKEHQLKSQLK